MRGFKAELQMEPLIKMIEVPGIQSQVWIRKLSIRQIVAVAGTVFTAIPVEGEGEDRQVDTRELIASGQLGDLLEAYEKLVLLGVVWGERPEGLGEDEVWGDPQEPCLEESDLVPLDSEQIQIIGTAILEYSGMTKEASQLAEHFPDKGGKEGSDSSPSALSNIWSPTVSTPTGGVVGSSD